MGACVGGNEEVLRRKPPIDESETDSKRRDPAKDRGDQRKSADCWAQTRSAPEKRHDPADELAERAGAGWVEYIPENLTQRKEDDERPDDLQQYV